MAAVRGAVEESLAGGVLAGYPMVDIRVALVAVTFDEHQTSEAAFHSAASIAFNRGVQQAKPILLEPVMRVEVVVPDENAGDVIGDMNGRRGEIQGMEPGGGGMQAVKGHVPLAEMFGYATDLRSATQGAVRSPWSSITMRPCPRAFRSGFSAGH